RGGCWSTTIVRRRQPLLCTSDSSIPLGRKGTWRDKSMGITGSWDKCPVELARIRMAALWSGVSSHNSLLASSSMLAVRIVAGQPKGWDHQSPEQCTCPVVQEEEISLPALRIRPVGYLPTHLA
nr:hypothetical protein [Tanacetum cinerariifolium]